MYINIPDVFGSIQLSERVGGAQRCSGPQSHPRRVWYHSRLAALRVAVFFDVRRRVSVYAPACYVLYAPVCTCVVVRVRTGALVLSCKRVCERV